MQFTPQQLAGGLRYGSQTRIGNWQEDVVLEEAKIAEFRAAKAHGKLTMGLRQRKIVKCNTAVKQSYSEDGIVRVGQTVLLEHRMTGGSLSSDIWDASAENEFVVTISPNTAFVARNAFTIMPIADERLMDTVRYPGDDRLHYGQSVHLKCNDLLLVDESMDMLKAPLFLSSALKTQNKGSRISNRQAVFMSPKLDTYSVWTVNKVSEGDTGKDRLLHLGDPVRAGDPIVLRHRATGQSLFCDPSVIESTEFGDEYEACCYNEFRKGCKEGLIGEAKGTLIPMTNVRAEQPNNMWAIRLSPDGTSAAADIELPPPMSVPAILEKLKALTPEDQKFADAVGNSKRITREDLGWALKDFYGPSLAEPQVKLLLDYFDVRKDGVIDGSALLGVL